MASSLPQAILDLATFHPVEKIVLALMRDSALNTAPVQINSLIADEQTWPLILPRRGLDWGVWGGDSRFIDTGTLTVQTFCEGLNADSDAAYLAEAVRVVLMQSLNKVTTFGYLTECDLLTAAHRVTDWASATGPVQFADLPSGVMRYETTYGLAIRAPRK